MKYKAPLAFLLLYFVAFFAGPVFSQKNSAVKQVDKAMMEYMENISRQLGVTCNYCHNVDNFADSSMATFQISKEHMRIVHLLNTEGFIGHRAMKVDCYVCHQGKPKFQYKQKMGL